MTIETFEKEHKKHGGINQLLSMKNRLLTLEEIANHFNVSKTRVAQWMRDLFEEEYDPRKARRDKEVKEIALLIKKHGLQKTKEIYQSINRNYLVEAIKISKKKWK